MSHFAPATCLLSASGIRLFVFSPLLAQPMSGELEIGSALYRKKEYEAAAKALKRAVDLDPRRADARFNHALAQLANRKAGAISQYNFLKESNPELAQKIYGWIFRDQILFVKKR